MAADTLLQENAVFLRYALNGKLAEKYLPEPMVRTNKHGNKTRFWWQSDVEKAILLGYSGHSLTKVAYDNQDFNNSFPRRYVSLRRILS